MLRALSLPPPVGELERELERELPRELDSGVLAAGGCSCSGEVSDSRPPGVPEPAVNDSEPLPMAVLPLSGVVGIGGAENAPDDDCDGEAVTK